MSAHRRANSQHRVAVLLAAEERFDGRGGAVATWVRDVYSRLNQESAIYCVSSSKSYGGSLTVAGSRWYRVYDRAAAWAARIIGPLVRRPWWGVHNRLLFGGKLWVAANSRALRQEQVVHIHNRPRYALWLRSRGYTGVIVLHMHNDLLGYVDRSEFPALRAAVNSFAFCSQYLMQKAARDFGPHPGEVLYNCVDTSRAFGVPQGVRRPNSLAFVGRLVPEKGALEAIRVCQALNDIDPGAQWTLDIYGGAAVGVSPYETDYTREVGMLSADVNRAAGREVVRLRGHLSHERLAESLATATFFLYPCQWEEPFGMVLIEAMALGLIPVASRKGGIGEIVDHGINGVLIDDAADEGGFASEILRLSRKADVLDAMRSRGLESARRFSPEIAAKDLTALLDRLQDNALTVGDSS